jgi:hypothetical protein
MDRRPPRRPADQAVGLRGGEFIFFFNFCSCRVDVMSSANSSPRREAASPPHQDVAMRKSRYRRYPAVCTRVLAVTETIQVHFEAGGGSSVGCDGLRRIV